MVDYYAQLNPDKTDTNILNRREILRLNDFGAQVGFALSVLENRGLFQAGEDPIRCDSNTVFPILTWPFLDYLDHLDLGSQTLLELGAGYSTVWFSTRFGKVNSLEPNPEWQLAVSKMVGDNVEVSLIDLQALETAAFEYKGEDWILLDFAGKRTKFLHHFFSHLVDSKKPTVIILDNSDAYRNGAAILCSNGYLEIPFFGFKSGQSWLSCTSLFIDPLRFHPVQREPFLQPPFSRTIPNSWDAP